MVLKPFSPRRIRQEPPLLPGSGSCEDAGKRVSAIHDGSRFIHEVGCGIAGGNGAIAQLLNQLIHQRVHLSRGGGISGGHSGAVGRNHIVDEGNHLLVVRVQLGRNSMLFRKKFTTFTASSCWLPWADTEKNWLGLR